MSSGHVNRSKLPEAKLSIQIPEGAWVSDVSTSYPGTTFRVLSAYTDDDEGVGVVEIETGEGEEIASVVREMSEHEALAEVEPLWTEGGDALVRFRTRRPMMLLAARRSEMPVRMPFEIEDGVGTWEFMASRERLSDLSDTLEDMGMSYDVVRVGRIRSDDLLTDKQSEVVQAALEAGYYDTPRRASLSEVADECGIAKSTCSETLHRAEEKIVKDFFG